MEYFYKKLKIPNGVENKVLENGTDGVVQPSEIDTSDVASNADLGAIDERVTNLEEVTEDMAERLHAING